MQGPSEVILANENLPQQLYIIPIAGKPLFPGMFTPILINEQDDIALVEKAMEGDRLIGLVLTRDGEDEDYDSQELYEVGTVARISRKINLPDGNVNIFIATLKRFRMTELVSSNYPIRAEVEYLDDHFDSDADELKGLTGALLSELKRLTENNPLFTEEMRLNMVNIDQPGTIADFTASLLNLPRDVQQEILEQLDIAKRIEHVLIYIKREQDLLQIQRKVAQRINEKIEKNQREYFLREEIKAIKKELGEPADARSSDAIKFQEKIEQLKLAPDILEQVNQELEKFALMEPSSAEYTVTRNYLDTIVNLPWSEPEEENISIAKAEKILNRRHYALDDVKQRILEYLAVRALKKDSKGAIICLVGPPGVGKTSIGKSIAETLGRPFYRFSVGGMRDEAEIKGHRRTYIGAMPGKMLQGLKVTKTKAPVFMIDEIDKIGSSYHGDPSSALLEALDPEQNIEFRDHYLDLPFDLSHVLFVTTANTLEGIPSALLDRMEVIRLSGYIMEEKVKIASRHLIPKSLSRHGLAKEQVHYSLPALRAIANEYAREAGMRNYEKALDRIHRKIAFDISQKLDARNTKRAAKVPAKKTAAKKASASKNLEPKFYKPRIEIKPEDLVKYLKQPIFQVDPQRMITQPGMAMGLAWTGMGGDTLVIESVKLAGKGELRLTGQMGNVMKESAAIALSVAKKHFENNLKSPKWSSFDIHLHIPEGATPKDGPSAGITMAISMISLLEDRKLPSNFAMTGELSLTGQVLPIGGLREKTIAAKRYGIKDIIIPQQNQRDLDEIPEYVRKGVNFHPVSEFSQVYKILLGSKD